MIRKAIVLILAGVTGLAGTAWGAYCPASGGCGGGFPGGEYISDVTVGSINNTGTSCDGYADYTSLSTTMETGTDYPITVVNGDGWLWEETCGIWVDWNQDEDFDDAGEEISVSGGPKTFMGTITPPGDANLGGTRMRVRIRHSGVPEACGDTTYGEVEDYTINVIAAVPEYCEAQGGTSGCDRRISRFRLKTIDNSTSDCDHYSDFTSISTELEIGTGYPFIVTGDHATFCGVWVDWNQDMDFDDANEQIDVTDFSFSHPPYGDGLYTIYDIGIITPPEEAVLGETRLRVRTCGGIEPGCGGPCGDTPYGEVEDYTVIVSESGTSGEEGYCGGQGTEEEPFLICTAEQMQAIGENNHHWGKHFKLMANIDLNDFEPNAFNIIGDYMFGFTGVFDGNGHAICNFTYIGTDEDRIGIFGEVSGNAVIKNLGLVDPNVQVLEGQGVGTLAGVHKGGAISNCYVRGGFVSGEKAIGGLVGGNHGTVENCYSRSHVFGNDCVGGLVGYMLSGQIEDCYSASSVLGQTAFGYGGLIGCVAGGSMVNSFWDMEICVNSAGGTGKTTTEMQRESTFTDAGWDFVEVWDIGEDRTYPFLRRYAAGDLDHDGEVDFGDAEILCSRWLEERE
jgi:hypothetical protein